MRRSRLAHAMLGAHALLGAVVAAPAARAADVEKPSVHLSWVRTPEASDCVDAARVQADVERRLGWSPFDSGSSSASIESLVARTDAGWRATIVLRSADDAEVGARQVESNADTCESLGKASALAIALMIEAVYPELSAPDIAPEVVAPEVVAPPTTELQAPAPLVALEATGGGDIADAAPPAGFEFAGGVLCSIGVLPGLACGAALRTELALTEHLSARVGVGFLPEQQVMAEAADVSLGLTFASLGSCYRLQLGEAWTVAGCASLAFGALHVTVENPSPLATGQRAWWALSPGLGLAWHHGAFQIHGNIDAIAPLDRRSYSVERAQPTERVSVYEEGPLGAMGTLEAGVQF